MKIGYLIATIYICLCVCSVNCVGDKANDFINSSVKLTFGKYYEPYEMDFEPNAPGYTLPLDINDIVNYEHVNSKINLTNVRHLIQQNGFAVLESDFFDGSRGKGMLFESGFRYELVSDAGIPIFITVDSLLHNYHIQFEQAFKEIESNLFTSDLKSLTDTLLNYNLELYDKLDGDLKEATKRNIAYLSVAQQLLAPESNIPKIVVDIVAREVEKIRAHKGFAISDIFKYPEDYSQYIPRGRYAATISLQSYFSAIMWYGRMTFLQNGGSGALISEQDARIQTLQALLLAVSLERAEDSGRSALEILDRMDKIIEFFVGTSDNISANEYLLVLKKVLGENFQFNDIDDPDNFKAIRNELALLTAPVVIDGFFDPAASLEKNLERTKGMRLMGQRFIPDSYIFQRLVYPKVGNYTGGSNRPFTYGEPGVRAYPRGLDLMALLGSDEAKQILINEGDTNYAGYFNQFEKLKEELNNISLPQWNRNLYWSWLYSLKSLLTTLPQGYPNFMRTSAWQRRQLNVALASWVQLRHDTILYTKMSGAAGGVIIPGKSTPPPGYVEPNIVLWGRLLALTRMTYKGLADLDALSPTASRRLKALDNVLSRLIVIVKKELTNQRLTNDENELIKNFSVGKDQPINLGVPDSDFKSEFVADVHTYNTEGLALEEGISTREWIVVACPGPEGSIFLAAGPYVFSYYEFKQPLSDRLSDEEWQKMLFSPQSPERPKWYIPLMR